MNGASPWLILVAGAALLTAHAAWYYPFFSDDALISLRYSQRFADGHGLTWTAGERVEGYTNFLWVVILAIAERVGFDLIWSARTLAWVGVLCALIFVGTSPKTGRLSEGRLLSGGLMLIASSPIAIWGIGGLEQGVMAGVLASALYLLRREDFSVNARTRRLLVVGFCALVLLRADGVVLVAGLLVGYCLEVGVSSASVQRGLRLALWPAALLAAQLVFRRLYYDSFQPNTALAKLALNYDRLELGLNHVAKGLAAAAAMLLAAALGTGFLLRRRTARATLPAWSLVAIWSSYQVTVGGDIFPGWRQLVFVVVALAFILAEVGERFSSRRWEAVLLLWLSVAALHLHLQLADPENRRAKAELWEWDGLAIGTLLKQAFGEREPLLAVDAAGALPYWSGLPSLDMLGLNDRYIALHPPPTFGTGPIGHELGDGAYVLSRAPDILAFNNASGAREPRFLSGKQLVALPEFRRTYQLIVVRAGSTIGELWVRREGGRLGVVHLDGGLRIPGYFLTGQESDAIAELDVESRLVAVVSNERPGILPSLAAQRGRYLLQVQADREDLSIDVRCDGRSMQRVSGDRALVLELQQSTGVGVAIAPHGSIAQVRAIALTQTDKQPTLECVNVAEPLSVDARSLSTPRSEHFYWAHPGNAVFGERGAILKLLHAVEASKLELSVDNNDEYLVRAMLHGNVVFNVTLQPRANGGGLAVHQLPLGAPVELDSVHISPVRGDGNYSVGHLTVAR